VQGSADEKHAGVSVKTVVRRLARLEDRLAPAEHKPRKLMRIVVTQCGSNPGLDGAECTRTLCEDGTLLEVVKLLGDRKAPGQLTDEELELWVASFPIDVLGIGRAG
jgi:hypothetical protein